MAALEMETPPWLICDAATSPLSPRCSHAMNQWTDDVNEPEDVPAPHFCNTCGALHRGPVCRCMQLTIAHPIPRILNKIACELAAVTPPAPPPVTERWEMSPNRSEAPLSDESSTQPHRRCVDDEKKLCWACNVWEPCGHRVSLARLTSNTSILDWFVVGATTARATLTEDSIVYTVNMPRCSG